MGDDEQQGGGRRMSQQRILKLKSLMLNKAIEGLKQESQQKAADKKAALSSRLEPLKDLKSLSQQELMELLRDLQAKIEERDEERYNVMIKVQKNDQEINDLNQKIFDLRGKFKRPPLRRVRISAEQMLKALLGSKHNVSMDLRSNLKTVKKPEPKKEEAEVKDWRESVDAKAGMDNKKSLFEGAQ